MRQPMKTSKAIHQPLALCLLAVILLAGTPRTQANQASDEAFRQFFKGRQLVGRRKLQEPATATQKFQWVGVRVAAAVLTKVSGCPGVTLRDVAQVVTKSVVKGRIGPITDAPTTEAGRFANSAITMYIAPKKIEAARLQAVLGPIGSQLSVLRYCPFQDDYVLDLQVTIKSIQPANKRTLTAADRKVLACLPGLKLTVRSGHIGTFATAAAGKAGTLVFPYVLAPYIKP